MKTFLLGFVTAIVVWPAAVLGYFSLGQAETRSDARPPAWERQLMSSTVDASVRRSAAGLHAPVPSNVEDAVAEGGRLYLNGCAGCHGKPGKPREDLDHYPPVPQLAQVGTHYSEPEIYWIVKHGVRNTAMSAYGPFYSDKEMWALASFLRQIDHLPPAVLERIQAKKGPDTSKD